LADFGLSRRINHEHKRSKRVAGTIAYMSVDVHEGWRRSIGCFLPSLILTTNAGHYPKDDFESFVYVLLFVCKGSLPWDDKSAEHTLSLKRKISAAELTHGLRKEFQELLVYARCLR
jgi:hypothetical protein